MSDTHPGTHKDSTTVSTNRRRFLAQAGIGVAGIAGLGVLGVDQLSAHADEALDINILNFALNLEYLEAEFYLRAAFGTGLGDGETGGVGEKGSVLGGSKVPFKTSVIRQYAEEIAMDERNHVLFLRSALGKQRVARPRINLQNSFTFAARAAGVVGPDQNFNPFADEDSFLLGAFIFEDVGVTAYKGAAPLISNKGFLEAAAGLLAVEAYHAGEIRTVLFARGQDNPALIVAANKISNLRDGVDGPDNRDQGITTNGQADGPANIVPTDNNGLAFSRSARQVLNIVYLGVDRSEGGFFPKGLNGAIS
jgi:hypothetical protein